MYKSLVKKKLRLIFPKNFTPLKSKTSVITFLRFNNWKKKRRFRIRKNLRFRWRFARFLRIITGRALFFVFIRLGRGFALKCNSWLRKKLGVKRKRYAIYRKRVMRFLNKIVSFYRATATLIKSYQKRRYVSFRRLLNLSFQTNLFYLRHFEINYKINGLVLLPIPYTFFYSFLLDQTFLWKTLMLELYTAYRRR